jgi:hypothetical protein
VPGGTLSQKLASRIDAGIEPIRFAESLRKALCALGVLCGEIKYYLVNPVNPVKKI